MRRRIKMFAAAALAVGAVGVGGLATAPSASALPSEASCDLLTVNANNYHRWGQLYYEWGYYDLAASYYGTSFTYTAAAARCYASL
jgi:hypothetical protein